jgi:hypothetical protein
MIKVKFLVTSTVEAVNGRTFEGGKAYWLRPDQYSFWDARGRIGPAPEDMPTENAPFSIMRAGRETFDVVGPSNRRLNTSALPWGDAEALRASAEADWLAGGRLAVEVATAPAMTVSEPPQIDHEPALTPSAPAVVSIDIDVAKAVADAGLEAADAGKEQDAVQEFIVAKGPGGRFFVKRGDMNVSRGFSTEEEAEAEKAKIAATMT